MRPDRLLGSDCPALYPILITLGFIVGALGATEGF